MNSWHMRRVPVMAEVHDQISVKSLYTWSLFPLLTLNSFNVLCSDAPASVLYIRRMFPIKYNFGFFVRRERKLEGTLKRPSKHGENQPNCILT